MRSKEKKYFDGIAATFDTEFNVYLKPAGKARVLRRAKLFAENCSFQPGARVLEIGCGTGEYSRALLEEIPVLFATDFSLNMARAAKKKAGPQAEVFISDIELLPVRDNVFDAVLGNSVLHHINMDMALKQIYRILKKGGRFAFSEPNMLNPQIFIQKKVKFIKKFSGDTPEETAFFARGLKKAFEKSGFKNVSVRPFDFLHPQTPGFLVKPMEQFGLVLEKTLLKKIAGSLFITGEK